MAGPVPARGRGPLAQLGSALVTATLTLALVGILVLGVGPLFLPYRTYTILSGSMEPTIHTGAVAFAVPASAHSLRVGDIITLQRPGRQGEMVTHRVYRIVNGKDGWGLITKGDANGAPDAWVVPDTQTGYKYAFSIPWAGYALNQLQTLTGRLILVLGLGLLLAGSFLRDIWRRPTGPGSARSAR